MTKTNILNVYNLSKTYHTILGETHAIKDITFDINKDEFVGIIGPSGCGKSSILNLISGLDKDYTGCININKNILFNNNIRSKIINIYYLYSALIG